MTPIDTSTNDLVSPVTKTRAVALDDSDSDEENEIESNLNLIPDAQTNNSATEIQAHVPENEINPNSNALTHEDIMDSPSQEIPKIIEPEQTDQGFQTYGLRPRKDMNYKNMHEGKINHGKPEDTSDTNPLPTFNAEIITDDEAIAKEHELHEWQKRGVYNEVEDEGQNDITLRWVLKDKTMSDKRVIKKARLCERGFQEEQNFRTDSPTCSKEGLRVALTTIASHK